MSTTEAQSAANKANAAHSTGPKTETGKSRSSKNRLTFGLFTISDFVREDESESYTKICTNLWSRTLSRRNHRRSFHHRNHERHLASPPLPHGRRGYRQIAILDPMQDPETAAQQKSVDRARAQSVNIMNRCINALRKLQTERGIRSQAFPETDVPAGLGLMDIRQVAKTKPMDTDAEPEPAPAAAAPAATPTGFDALMALADKQLAQRYRDYGMAAFTGAPTSPPPRGSFPPPVLRSMFPILSVRKPSRRRATSPLLRSMFLILSVRKPSRRRTTNGQWVRIVNRPQRLPRHPRNLLPLLRSSPFQALSVLNPMRR